MKSYVPFILANPAEIDKPILDFDGNTFQQNLDLGEYWENVVTSNLRQRGIEAWRPCQKFSDRNDYRKKQQDVLIINPLDGREYTVDIKARNNPFGYSTYFVGSTKKWDEREYESIAVVIIDATTGEAKATPANAKSRQDWTIGYGREPSYQVSSKNFYSFDRFVDCITRCPIKK